MGTNEYVSQTPGQIPIVAFNIYNYADDISLSASAKEAKIRKICEGAVDCGFNLGLQSIGMSTISPLLKGMEGTGMKMIVGNGTLLNQSAYESFVKGYLNYSSLAGWYLARLPKFNELQTIKTFQYQIKQADPNHLIYYQLIENLSSGSSATDPGYTNGFQSYMEYLRYVQNVKVVVMEKDEETGKDVPTEKDVHPEIWSNNFNPIQYLNDGTVKKHLPTFYKNLSQLRQISMESGNPFWTFCQCEKFTEPGGYRKGTLASMRFQTYSALAYGAQGLIFSAYQQRKNGAGIEFSESPIDSAGNRTAMWYTVQELIAEIRAYTHIFLGGQPVDIRNTGNLGIEQINYGPGSTFGPCESITAGSQGVLLTLFNNQGRQYLVVVNHDVDNSQTVTLKFSRLFKITEETPVELFGNASTVTNDTTITATRPIPAGGCIIFRYGSCFY